MALKNTIGIISPYYSKNYVWDGSGEGGIWFNPVGSASVSRVTTHQKYGLYAYEITTTGAGDGIGLNSSVLDNEPYYVTFRGKLSGVNLEIFLDFGVITKEVRLLEKIDAEWGLYGAILPASAAFLNSGLNITQVGAGAYTFYIDGVQMEPVTEEVGYTTYIDGTQAGCSWLGAPHASASERSADSRAGGIVKDFYKGYGFFPEKILGAGAAPEELNIDSYAFLPGGELNSSKIPPREFSIVGYFLGDTEEELHEKQQALELELGLDTYPGRQPVRLRFSGAKVQKEIAAHYAGGLEGELPVYYNNQWSVEDEKWVRNHKFKMRASIQFIATDPFWHEVGESATLLDTNESSIFRLAAARLRSTGGWDNLGPPLGTGSYTTLNAIVEDDTYIYFGGQFSDWNDATSDNIVRYNKETRAYSPIDIGLNGTVNTMAIAPNGDLYVGGTFTNASGVAAADYLARLPAGSSPPVFVAVGAPLSGTASITSVNVLKFDLQGNLYIGGVFTDWANIAGADGIVMWDGANYNAVGTGAGSFSVNAIDVFSDNTLLIGGNFTSFSGTAANSIVHWDPATATATALGTGMDALVNVIKIIPGDIAYIGGAFTTANGISASRIVAYDRSSFIPLGEGVDNSVSSMAYYNGNLYVGGVFDTAGDLVSEGFALWNGYSWAHIDLDLSSTSNVKAIHIGKVDPIVSRNFDLWIGFNLDTTLAYSGQVTASNGGTISAFPKIVFTRSGGTGATIQTLRNERTGRQLLFDYDLLDGETLTIDLDPKVRKITSSFFGERMDARLKNDDFGVWQLLPGENEVTAFVSESGGPTVTGYLLYRKAYRSLN